MNSFESAPAKRQFEVQVGRLPGISLFHVGRPRHYRGRLRMTATLDAIQGTLGYKVGEGRAKVRVERDILCGFTGK